MFVPMLPLPLLLDDCVRCERAEMSYRPGHCSPSILKLLEWICMQQQHQVDLILYTLQNIYKSTAIVYYTQLSPKHRHRCRPRVIVFSVSRVSYAIWFVILWLVLTAFEYLYWVGVSAQYSIWMCIILLLLYVEFGKCSLSWLWARILNELNHTFPVLKFFFFFIVVCVLLSIDKCILRCKMFVLKYSYGDCMELGI